jgi:predicted RNA-binding protein with PUA-like domain
MHQPDAAAKRNFWLIKFAAFRTSWPEIVRRGKFTLRGVRSAAARKHLAAMRLGDATLFYRSQTDQAIVGVLEVVREAYPDPTSADAQWLTCDFAPVETLPRGVALSEIRADSRLEGIALFRQTRLSVMPVSPGEFKAVLDLASSGANPR